MNDQKEPEAESASNQWNLDYNTIGYMVGQLAGAIADSKEPPKADDDPVILQNDYQSTLEIIKLLSDIRFRCLVFVTSVIAVANILLTNSGNYGARITLGFVGFFTTLGIAVYELRNSQLYEAAIHRARALEREPLLKRIKSSDQAKDGGLFNERPFYVEKEYGKNLRLVPWNSLEDPQLMRFLFVKVKHDRGLALIYGAVLGGWVYLIADGILSIPAPTGYWRPAPAGLIGIIAGVIGFSAFVLATREFLHHDEHRFGLSLPREPHEHEIGLERTRLRHQPNKATNSITLAKHPFRWVGRKMRGPSDPAKNCPLT